MFVNRKEDLRQGLGDIAEEFMYRDAEELNSKLDRLKRNPRRRLEIIHAVRKRISRDLNFVALLSGGVVCRFSNRGLCVKRFCKPLVCGASAGSWFSPRSAHGRRMMGRRGSALQGLKRGPRAAANRHSEWPPLRNRLSRLLRPRLTQRPPGRTPGSPDGGRSAERPQTIKSSLLRSRGSEPVVGIEVLSGLPHDMEHRCELARLAHGGALEAETLVERQSKGAQRADRAHQGAGSRLRPRKAARATVRLPAARYAHRSPFRPTGAPGLDPGAPTPRACLKLAGDSMAAA